MGGDVALQAQLGLVLDPLAPPSAVPEDLMVEPDPPARALEHLAAVVDVDLRLTDAAVALQMLCFVADCRCQDGALLSNRSGEPRFMLLAPVLAPRLRSTSLSALFAHAKQHGVSFDLISYLGTLFVELDMFAGHVSLGTVASTQPAVVNAAMHALATVEKGGKKVDTGPYAQPALLGPHIAAAIAALRIVQRRLDKQRAFLHRE